MTTVTILFPFDPRRKVVSSASREEWIVFVESWDIALFGIRSALLMLLIAANADPISFAL
jgi:hypothetical protein